MRIIVEVSFSDAYVLNGCLMVVLGERTNYIRGGEYEREKEKRR